MDTKTPLPKIEKHSLTIGANGQGKHLRMHKRYCSKCKINL